MKKVALVFMLVLGFAWNCHAQTWTYVQDSLTTGGNCVVGTTSCTINVANGNSLPTTAGSVWVAIVSTGNDATITSVTGGGGTWSLCPASSCHVFNSTLVRNVDAAYNLSGAAGTNSVTVNISTASVGLFKVNLIELMPPSGSTASFDDAGTSTSTTCTAACPGVGLTLSGTDAIVQYQGIHDPAGWNAWSSPYVTDTQGDGVYLNATSGAAPTVAMGKPGAIITALAFKSTAGSFTPPPRPMSVVNFSNPTGINCTPSCSLAIPSTGSGHLLYIEAGDIASNYISTVSGGGTWVVPTGSNSCRINMSGGFALSCAYVLSSTPGATTLNVTMTGTSNDYFAVWEVANSAGGFAFDTEGSATNAPSTDPSGVGLTLSGKNDVIMQAAFVPGGPSSVNLYPMPYIPGNSSMFFNNQAGQTALLNTTSGTALRWSNEQNNQTIVTGIAFKSTGTATAPNPPTNLKAVVN